SLSEGERIVQVHVDLDMAERCRAGPHILAGCFFDSGSSALHHCEDEEAGCRSLARTAPCWTRFAAAIATRSSAFIGTTSPSWAAFCGGAFRCAEEKAWRHSR